MISVQRTSGADKGACFVCAKHRGEIIVPGGAIYQDEVLYVGHRAPPAGGPDTYLGYVLVETRRHASGLADLSRTEAQAVGAWVTQIARALTAVVQAEHVYAFVLGHHVPHFHEHVVARYPQHATGVLGTSGRPVARCAAQRRPSDHTPMRPAPQLAGEQPAAPVVARLASYELG
jgi:histidine triad (HIT) family protein